MTKLTRYVYALVCQRTGDWLYIGKTKNTDRRVRDHRRSPHNYRLERFIERGGAFYLRIISVTNVDDVDLAERAIVRECERQGMDLFNIKLRDQENPSRRRNWRQIWSRVWKRMKTT